jgi:magnesium transporter
MVRLLPKKLRPVGLPAGSLLYTSESRAKSETIRLSIMDYTEDKITEKETTSINECLQYIETPGMTWIQVYGVSNPQTVAAIGQHFKLHALVLEDILHTGQRSKLDVYQDQVFLVVRLLQYEEVTKALKDQQVSIVFGPNYLISFVEGNEEIFKPIKEQLRQKSQRIRKQGSDYLAYAILDMIVDYYFVVLEKVDEKLDQLEEELTQLPVPRTSQKIQHAKRDMIVLRRAIWPLRDVVNRFLRLENPLITPTTQLYLHDVYDHIVQTIDIIEGFRDVVSSMLDIYLSNINIRTNEIMKVLTIVSTIFVPMTFIASLYGMNFEHMPELHSKWGYPLALVLMIGVAFGMLIFFRHKKWI